MTQDEAKRTVVKVGKTVQEHKQAALAMFEALRGRKATQKELADLDELAKEMEQDEST